MIRILDYGAGNLKSVCNALRYIGCEAEITNDAQVLMESGAAILPGVGAFGDAAASLRNSGLWQPALDYIESGRPFLGICLGMQLLFEESEETPGVSGLGVFPGKICRIPDGEGLKIPHMGWNSLDIQKQDGLFANVPQQSYVYFVHSYYLHSLEREIVSSCTTYGVQIDASVQSGNVFGAQFHPEKSGEAGLQMLRNFANIEKNHQNR